MSGMMDKLVQVLQDVNGRKPVDKFNINMRSPLSQRGPNRSAVGHYTCCALALAVTTLPRFPAATYAAPRISDWGPTAPPVRPGHLCLLRYVRATAERAVAQCMPC